MSALAIGLVTRALGQLRTALPGVTVSLQEGDNAHLVEQAGAVAVDLAVCAEVKVARGLVFEHLLDDELMLVTPRTSRLARQRQVPWSALAHEPLIFTNRGTSTREHASAALEKHRVACRVDVEVSSMATAIAMVRSGFGSAFVSRVGLKDLATEGVQVVAIAEPPVRRIGIYRLVDRQPAAATVKFMKLLQQEAAATRERLERDGWRI